MPPEHVDGMADLIARDLGLLADRTKRRIIEAALEQYWADKAAVVYPLASVREVMADVLSLDLEDDDILQAMADIIEDMNPSPGEDHPVYPDELLDMLSDWAEENT